jgi:UDPglucose 6-dehydrogenase
MDRLAVIGAGYVGLVTGACFAQKGFRVVIIENNLEKIKQLLIGNIPFYEPHLDVVVRDGLASGLLVFENSIQAGLAHNPTVIFSCVGTPPLPSGEADLSFVEKAAEEIGRTINDYALIINKSTVPVGTVKKVHAIIAHELLQRNLNVEFDVASNPEFLKEGDAVKDFLFPDRIVIGVESEKAAVILKSLYKPFIMQDSQLIIMNPASAELTKYASNAMLATRISFMNQLAHLADLVDADIEDVRHGMSKDKRIGKEFLFAGIGYGGSCFPKDTQALIQIGKQQHYPMTLVQEVENINHYQRVWFINKIITHYGPALAHKTIGVWGLSFKPETDDLRCAPSIELVNEILYKDAKVIVYDPIALSNFKALYGDKITYASTASEILNQADSLIILTEWNEFLAYAPQDFALLKDKTIFDGRNCYDPIAMSTYGIKYFCVGRNSLSRQLQQQPYTTHKHIHHQTQVP